MRGDRNFIKEDDFIVSNNYEKSLDEEVKKSSGIYYTPKFIVEYIMEKTLYKHDIIENPYPKVFDMSCGCGNFLIVAYDVLYSMFRNNLKALSNKYGKNYWNENNLHSHIINNCIYGTDIDSEAINILRDSLSKKDLKNSCNYEKNIQCYDSLNYDNKYKFDYIIGNPPYVGHKNIDKSYREFLNKNFGEVYKDKSDLYFCFIKKIMDLLDEGGKSSIVTPRYFLESPSAKDLRNYINENISIEECVDFLGAKIFKNVGISSCILTFGNQKSKSYADVYRVKDEDMSMKNIERLSVYIRSDKFEHLKIKKDSLDDDWIIVDEDSEKFYTIIQNKCTFQLGDIVESFQGVITGCDKAFIYRKGDKRLDKINRKFLKSWVKNKDIQKYSVDSSDFQLVYSDIIEDEDDLDYFETLIEEYSERLKNRRECKKNIRKWHQLQWGRSVDLFERIKIMYPYKSKENKFAIDYDYNFSSADVYSFAIKEEYLNEFSYEYLVALLNSKVYDKYYKITAKKMSRGIYDYYPNKVLKMKIFKGENYKEIEYLSKQIIYEIRNKSQHSIQNAEYLQSEIDNLILKSLCLEGQNMVKYNS
ncbi:Eco57I restriction-modification methylase domain-containing protein [Metaclostridioides mangenotii]|uniref:site-specific DNA-methyltransferase (adenine-specific) n=1 Tax=Metaclostridioides mangenotii TaxID=1540 RepID=A0ABS4EBI9_9FIRM|nr:N-6 DNA methylase [Clostridioides mangenotii]MBP1855316.1 type I restriction-modification system DNA methylase subunit [Clostridioides mangenotii]